MTDGCTGCGSQEHSHCPQSPPERCPDCGGVNDWRNAAYCACWTSVEDLAPADLKALFADDCEDAGISLDMEAS